MVWNMLLGQNEIEKNVTVFKTDDLLYHKMKLKDELCELLILV